ncbi:hypothetical protein AALA24_09840 [Anaerovoracaceae bacterium 42-11]
MSTLHKKLMAEAEKLPKASAVKSAQKDDILIKNLHLQELIQDKENELKKLRQLQIYLEEGDRKKTASLVEKILPKNEAVFLRTKRLSALLNVENSFSGKPDWYIVHGKPEDFPAKLVMHDEGHYEFLLPPLSGKKIKDKNVSDGKAIHYLIMYLIREYEKENPQIKMMSRPTILFEHCIKKDAASYAPDPDNVEVKSVLDSLQNYFYENDSVLDITIIQAGRLSEFDHTKVHILAQKTSSETSL